MKLKNKILAGEERTVKKFAYLPTVLTINGNERELVWMKPYYRRYIYGSAYGWKIHQDSLVPFSENIDNLPLLSVDDVYSFMCNSGAYMPYNRPTHEMLRSIAKSKIK